MMVEAYGNWLREQGKVDGTIQSYILNIELYMRWYRETFGSDMMEMHHGNILDYRSYLQNVRRQKAVSINTKLSALISFDEFLTETGCQKVSAISRRDLLRVQSVYASPSILTEKDVDAFRQAVLTGSGPRDHALVTIMAYAGLRVSEALSLTPDDVDSVGRQITVHKGKGNKERVVFIGDKVIHAVKEYLRVRDVDSPYLFSSRKSDRLDRTAVNKLCRRFSDKITPHSLRHFYCSNALEKGYSFHEVANQAGHSNIHTTLRYTKPSTEAMKEKANKL